MDELRETALAEYRREGPAPRLTWKVWAVVFAAGLAVYWVVSAIRGPDLM